MPFFKEPPKINFIGVRKPALISSAAACLVSLMLLITVGLNLGIDFAGGLLLEIRTDITRIADTDDGLAVEVDLSSEGVEEADVRPLLDTLAGEYAATDNVAEARIDAIDNGLILTLVMPDGDIDTVRDALGADLQALRNLAPADLGLIRSIIGGVEGLGATAIQEFGTPTEVVIKAQVLEDTDEAVNNATNAIINALKEQYPTPIELRRSEFVGPSVGDELIEAGVIAVLLSLVGILIYVAIRFDLPYGVCAIAALAHDSIIIIGVFALLQLEFSLASVAAVLTIAGYSINDTVVVFDRVREMLRKYKKESVASLINRAINLTLRRSLLTSVTTLLALIALWIFGGAVLRDFITGLIIGVVVGTYSSILVASPLLLNFALRPSDKKLKEQEVELAKP